MVWERSVVIKTQAEIGIMQAAGQINALALDTVRKMIQPGITTAELDAAAEEVIRSHGGVPTFKGYPGPYPFPATLTISINEELVHGIPSNRRLKSWDIVFSIGVGEISEQAEHLLKITEEALYEGIKKMHSGNRVGDVSAAIQEIVEKNGYQVPREYSGHGVGRQMHEAPQVPNYGKPGRGLALRPGVTIAIEPMLLVGTYRTRVLPDQWTVVSADNSLTAHFEHSVAVMDGDPVILTALN